MVMNDFNRCNSIEEKTFLLSASVCLFVLIWKFNKRSVKNNVLFNCSSFGVSSLQFHALFLYIFVVTKNATPFLRKKHISFCLSIQWCKACK